MLLYLSGFYLLYSPNLSTWLSIILVRYVLFAVVQWHASLADLHDQRWVSPPGGPPRPDLRDGTVQEWFNWSPSNFSLGPFPHSAEVSLELPIDSDAIYLFTRGSQSGHVDIVQSTTPTDKVGVQVRVNYFNPEVLDYINVCRVERGANENGVGIIVGT